MTCHYVEPDEMYELHHKVLTGLEAGGKQPSEISGAQADTQALSSTPPGRRLLCWVLTYPANHMDMQAKAIVRSWGSKCA